MNRALIGYSGFVGGNLDRQMNFSHRYNSSNIGEIRGQWFDEIVCAGVPATKWLANRNPEEDAQAINLLTDNLQQAHADRFVLISTVDVYPDPREVTEHTEIDDAAGEPYGRHRRQLERLIARQFNTHVIRLPGLFGDGLKKNIIFDFLHDNNVEKIDPRGVFQFYHLKHLGADLATCVAQKIPVLNITSEPLSALEISRVCGRPLDTATFSSGAPARYDYRSVHADLFGGSNGYLYSRAEVLADLAAYVESQAANS